MSACVFVRGEGGAGVKVQWVPWIVYHTHTANNDLYCVNKKYILKKHLMAVNHFVWSINVFFLKKTKQLSFFHVKSRQVNFL